MRLKFKSKQRICTPGFRVLVDPKEKELVAEDLMFEVVPITT
jgi:hypothetical protein